MVLLMIKTVFLDLDDTIFDFHACEKVAISKTLLCFGADPCDEIVARYSEYNKLQWEALERGEITREQVLTRRFELLFDYLGIEVDPWQVQALYERNLSMEHIFMKGAEALLSELRDLGKYRLYAATNGIANVQWPRIRESGIESYFEAFFISEEIGSNKPSKEFFDGCFAQIPNFDISEAIIIGDSLTSDIRGGKNAGLKTCLFNPSKKTNLTDVIPDYEISELSEVVPLLEKL